MAGPAEHSRVLPAALDPAMCVIPSAGPAATFRSPDEHRPIAFSVMREMVYSAPAANTSQMCL